MEAEDMKNVDLSPVTLAAVKHPVAAEHVDAAVIGDVYEIALSLSQVQAPSVKSHADFDKANEVLEQVKQFERVLKKHRTESTRPIETIKKSVIAFFKAPQERAEKIKQAYIVEMRAFQREAERARLEEQRRAEAEARAAAEAERKRLEAEALEKLKAGQEEEAKQAISQKLDVKEEAVCVPEVEHKVDKRTFRPVWRWRVTDIDQVPKEFLVVEVNTKKLKDYAEMNAGSQSVPGVEFSDEHGFFPGEDSKKSVI